jgi:hypothetical protein
VRNDEREKGIEKESESEKGREGENGRRFRRVIENWRDDGGVRIRQRRDREGVRFLRFLGRNLIRWARGYNPKGRAG